jgi:dihydroorotate dehydrogenase
MYKTILKPIFFLLQPEKAHHLTMSLVKVVLAVPGISHFYKSLYRFEDPKLEKELFGLAFKNPVGLAAGFDKDGKYINAMASLGFGFIEVGTVTPLPQAGNPKPRLFRLPKDEALINRMGFNNGGVEQLVSQLKKSRPAGMIIGGNIGKNKVTPNEEAISDYEKCFEALFPYVDYFVVNVSSPNTPNLRELQDKEPLQALLSRVQELNMEKEAPKPVLLKIAPDLTNGQLDDIIDIVQVTKIAGVIATNTTISRAPLSTDSAAVEAIGNGGLSGKPLKERATEVIRYLKEKTNGELKIIGVGGIASAEDAKEKLEAGADLIQVYSGMVYSGPGLIKSIKKGLLG